MAKIKFNNTADTTLDPFSFERSVLGLQPGADPSANTKTPQDLEFVTDTKVEDGYSTFGNSQLASQYIQERKAYDQDSWYLGSAFAKNLVGTALTEVAKLPGYVAGGAMALGNEILGDGKDSMKLMVDNAWVNAFEGLNEDLKQVMPVTLSQSVQEGNLADKLGSGQWWATTGAEGVGFLASMFVPGAALKAAKLGKLVAPTVEAAANAGQKLDQLLNLPIAVRTTPFILGLKGQAKVEGFASMFANASLEAAAEAANTFDNVKQNYLSKGLSDSEANSKAGEAAAAIFKTNMVILPFTNLLDEMYLFKSLGKVDKNAGESVIGNLFKNGVLDTSDLSKLTKLTSTKNLSNAISKLAGGLVKEGFIEEGLQTISQQQVERGNIKSNPINQVLESLSKYTDNFWDNKELHESIALGGILGGAGGVLSSVQDVNNLKSALLGRAASSNWATKIGISRQKADQRGLASIISENLSNNFRSIKDLQIINESGQTVIDESKLEVLPKQQQDLLGLHLAYDAAVASNDRVKAEQLNIVLAQHYVGSFLGNDASRELFNQHVDNQLLPEWSSRYAEQYGQEPTTQQKQIFTQTFKDQSNQIFDAYDIARDTHQPERYVKPDGTPLYDEFRSKYFSEKYQTLLQIKTLQALNKEVISELSKQGVVTYDTTEGLTAIQKEYLSAGKKIMSETEELIQGFESHYSSLFTKEGVQQLYDTVKNQQSTLNKEREAIAKDVESTKEAIQQEVDQSTEKIKSFNESLLGLGYEDSEIRKAQDKDGNLYDIGEDFTTGEATLIKDGKVSILTDDEIIALDLTILPKASAEKLALDTEFDSFDDAAVEDVDDTLEDAPAQPTVTWENTFQSTAPFSTTGVNIQMKFENGKVKDELTEDGLPKLTNSVEQQRWFKKVATIDPTEHTVLSIKIKDLQTLSPIHQQQINSNLGTEVRQDDTFVILADLDGNIIEEDGKMFFTSLWRPTTLYTNLDNKFRSRLAPGAWLGEYLISKGVAIDARSVLSNFDVLTNVQKAQLGLNPKDGLDQLELRAWQYAKENYEEWYYKSLDKPLTQIPIESKSLGFKLRRRTPDGTVIWNALEIPFSNGNPVAGKFVQSYNGFVQVGNKPIPVTQGTTVFVNSDGYVDSLKPRKIDESELDILIYLLSLRSQAPFLESIRIPVKIKTGSTTKTIDLPVFWQEDKYSLLSGLINFKTKSSTVKYSIFFSGNQLTWVDATGATQQVPLSTLTQYLVDKVDTPNVKKLKEFLLTKNFNVNEKLLKENKKHLTYKLVRDKSGIPQLTLIQESFTYQEYLVNSKSLLTEEVKVEGYPERLQVNLQLSPAVKQIEKSVEEKSTAEPIKLNDLRGKLGNRPTLQIDKVLNPETLLQSKLQSGEIQQRCK